jgi:hypothetical protein
VRKTVLVAALMTALGPLLATGGAETSATTGLSATTGFSATTGSTAPKSIRARDILPAEGLIASSVAVLRDQAALNAHYYLADEDILGLGRTTDAVFARYKAGAGEALLLVAAYPDAEEAARVYGRFGEDFFSPAFDPAPGRFVEKIETDDWAGAARKGAVLIIVLESPDRDACDGLLRRAEDRVPAAKAK